MKARASISLIGWVTVAALASIPLASSYSTAAIDHAKLAPANEADELGSKDGVALKTGLALTPTADARAPKGTAGHAASTALSASTNNASAALAAISRSTAHSGALAVSSVHALQEVEQEDSNKFPDSCSGLSELTFVSHRCATRYLHYVGGLQAGDTLPTGFSTTNNYLCNLNTYDADQQADGAVTIDVFAPLRDLFKAEDPELANETGVTESMTAENARDHGIDLSYVTGLTASPIRASRFKEYDDMEPTIMSVAAEVQCNGASRCFSSKWLEIKRKWESVESNNERNKNCWYLGNGDPSDDMVGLHETATMTEYDKSVTYHLPKDGGRIMAKCGLDPEEPCDPGMMPKTLKIGYGDGNSCSSGDDPCNDPNSGCTCVTYGNQLESDCAAAATNDRAFKEESDKITNMQALLNIVVDAIMVVLDTIGAACDTVPFPFELGSAATCLHVDMLAIVTDNIRNVLDYKASAHVHRLGEAQTHPLNLAENAQERADSNTKLVAESTKACTKALNDQLRTEISLTEAKLRGAMDEMEKRIRQEIGNGIQCSESKARLENAQRTIDEVRSGHALVHSAVTQAMVLTGVPREWGLVDEALAHYTQLAQHMEGIAQDPIYPEEMGLAAALLNEATTMMPENMRLIEDMRNAAEAASMKRPGVCELVDVCATAENTTDCNVWAATLPASMSDHCAKVTPRVKLLEQSTKRLLDVYDSIVTRYVQHELAAPLYSSEPASDESAVDMLLSSVETSLNPTKPSVDTGWASSTPQARLHSFDDCSTRHHAPPVGLSWTIHGGSYVATLVEFEAETFRRTPAKKWITCKAGSTANKVTLLANALSPQEEIDCTQVTIKCGDDGRTCAAFSTAGTQQSFNSDHVQTYAYSNEGYAAYGHSIERALAGESTYAVEAGSGSRHGGVDFTATPGEICAEGIWFGSDPRTNVAVAERSLWEGVGNKMTIMDGSVSGDPLMECQSFCLAEPTCTEFIHKPLTGASVCEFFSVCNARKPDDNEYADLVTYSIGQVKGAMNLLYPEIYTHFWKKTQGLQRVYSEFAKTNLMLEVNDLACATVKKRHDGATLLAPVSRRAGEMCCRKTHMDMGSDEYRKCEAFVSGRCADPGCNSCNGYHDSNGGYCNALNRCYCHNGVPAAPGACPRHSPPGAMPMGPQRCSSCDDGFELVDHLCIPQGCTSDPNVATVYNAEQNPCIEATTIRTLQQCRDAVTSQGHSILEEWADNSYSRSSAPPGCSYSNDGDKILYFNEPHEGAGSCRIDKICYCQCNSATMERKLDLSNAVARQSSTYSTATADLALTQPMSPHVSTWGAGSCACTQKERNNWWEVDLPGGDHDVTRVRVLNRDWKPERLDGFTVLLDGNECGSGPEDVAASSWTEVECVGTGSRIRIRRPYNKNYMTVCGVEVYGSPSVS